VSWASLFDRHEFGEHEVVVFTRALTWWDVSDSLLTEAASLTGRERDSKLRAAGDASTAALRHWKTLRFTTRQPARRPGRPADAQWSAVRGVGTNAG
jgi:hypothetical protein